MKKQRKKQALRLQKQMIKPLSSTGQRVYGGMAGEQTFNTQDCCWPGSTITMLGCPIPDTTTL